MKKGFALVLSIYFFLGQAYADSVSNLDITVAGQGSSYQEALNNALLESISQVNGKVMESTKVSLNAEESITTSESEEYFSSDSYAALVRERTQGAISSYQILGSNEDAGIWTVEVISKVAKYKASTSSLRKRIVIVPAKASRGNFKILDKSIEGEEASRNVDQFISNVLVGTRKFAVLDRNNDESLQNEIAIAADASSPIEEAARFGQTLATDFVLIGKLEELRYSTVTKEMRTSDRKYTVGSGSASYSYSLIEVATAQVFFSDTVNIRITHEDVAQDSRSNPKAISRKILSKVASKVVKTLTSQIYPLSIIAKHGQEVILSEGGKSLKIGESYKVYKRESKIYDPYTKEFSGYEEFYCCTLKISRVAPKQSYALVLSGIDQLPEKIPPQKYILRGKAAKKAPKVIEVKPINQNNSDW